MMAAAFDAGINFFDNAEVYAGGRARCIMGEALKQLGWPRLNYVVSTKFFWGLDRNGEAVNRKDTLNRKYLMQALDGSLKRMQLEHIDLIYCHRPDPHTPVEETVRAMSDLITQGKALYWGTSEWSAADIRAAWEIAERHHLHKPVMEQPQYHLFHRQRVEQEYARLYDDIGLGLTTWSPLASGLLTGKYRAGVPEGSRGAMENMAFLRDGLTNPAEERRRGAAGSPSPPSWAAAGAAGDRLGGEEPAGLHRDHRRLALSAAAGQPGRAGVLDQAHARGDGAHRRDPRCCGSGTCIIDPEGRCWCGQQWNGEKMAAPTGGAPEPAPAAGPE
jgi:aryl-alcohol dehydrogenase-like predicted oxidoreductase